MFFSQLKCTKKYSIILVSRVSFLPGRNSNNRKDKFDYEWGVPRKYISLIVKCVPFIDYFVSLFMYKFSILSSRSILSVRSQKPLSTIRGKGHIVLLVKVSQQAHNKMPMLPLEETVLTTAKIL